MKSSHELTVAEKLGKEFWGVLSFELHLPALHGLLQGDELGLGLMRLSDWVIFPDKIPAVLQDKFIRRLEERKTSGSYTDLLDMEINFDEKRAHGLVLELMRMKYLDSAIDPERLHYIYQLPENVYYALSIQLVERGYLASRSAIEIFNRFTHIKRRE